MAHHRFYVLIAALVLLPAFAAGPQGFEHWTPAAIHQREQALSKNVQPDHSSRETLADYGDHRYRLLYRDGDGYPEQHDHIIDIVIVQTGEATLVLGGRMIGQKTGSGAGEWTGAKLEGGATHRLAAGDVVQIPAGVPHSFLVQPGKHITYMLLKIPAR